MNIIIFFIYGATCNAVAAMTQFADVCVYDIVTVPVEELSFCDDAVFGVMSVRVVSNIPVLAGVGFWSVKHASMTTSPVRTLATLTVAVVDSPLAFATPCVGVV